MAVSPKEGAREAASMGNESILSRVSPSCSPGLPIFPKHRDALQAVHPGTSPPESLAGRALHPREEIKGWTNHVWLPAQRSLSRHQMALIALLCTACGHPHVHSHSLSHPWLGLGHYAMGWGHGQGVQWHSRTVPAPQRLLWGLHLEARLLFELNLE